ncbi:hypothetical protein M1N69_03055 [Thermodesulfovibrionales bacterium]|nr:hypothetical protein [Thermodesulfovibrionales bacterium]
MTINESISIEEVVNCSLCETKGSPVYEEMHDRLFGASGFPSGGARVVLGDRCRQGDRADGQ